MNKQALEEALALLGDVLADQETPFGLLVIGGSSLLLLGLIDRSTADLDVIGLVDANSYSKMDFIPESLGSAAARVARAMGLADDWLNTRPADLMDLGLPDGWAKRISVRTFGALEVHLPSRQDQICFKLYAAIDSGPTGKHFADLYELTPNAEELLGAGRWAITHDSSTGFQQELRGCLHDLGVEWDHDVI